MEIIHGPASATATGEEISLPVDRQTLAKRRWRGLAEDGREFGFELAEPLHHGAVVLNEDGRSYVIAQRPEAVLELPIEDAAVIGWSIGNLHFQIEVTESAIRVEDDPALRQLFAREGWSYEACTRVFQPRQGGHHHAH